MGKSLEVRLREYDGTDGREGFSLPVPTRLRRWPVRRYEILHDGLGVLFVQDYSVYFPHLCDHSLPLLSIAVRLDHNVVSRVARPTLSANDFDSRSRREFRIRIVRWQSNRLLNRGC